MEAARIAAEEAAAQAEAERIAAEEEAALLTEGRLVELPGLEPGITGPESVVLPITP